MIMKILIRIKKCLILVIIQFKRKYYDGSNKQWLVRLDPKIRTKGVFVFGR